MLETIRELALEELAPRRGARGSGAVTPAGSSASRRRAARTGAAAPARAWLEQIGRERENLRAALAWGAFEAGDVETGLRSAAALLPFWTAHALYDEGRRFLAALLSRSHESSVGPRGRSRSQAGSPGSRAMPGVRAAPARESLELLPPGEEWYRASA